MDMPVDFARYLPVSASPHSKQGRLNRRLHLRKVISFKGNIALRIRRTRILTICRKCTDMHTRYSRYCCQGVPAGPGRLMRGSHQYQCETCKMSKNRFQKTSKGVQEIHSSMNTLRWQLAPLLLPKECENQKCEVVVPKVRLWLWCVHVKSLHHNINACSVDMQHWKVIPKPAWHWHFVLMPIALFASALLSGHLCDSSSTVLPCTLWLYYM